MISKIAVLCWEESRPWVSALRQNGYSVPWVEEPKGDSYKQIPRLEPDLVLIDLTRLPDQGKAMAVVLAGNTGAAISDDRPFNEYYLLRRWWAHYQRTGHL